MKKTLFFILLAAAFLLTSQNARCQVSMLDDGWHHIRNMEPREWSEFPEVAENQKLLIRFPSGRNESEQTLSLRQSDVKLTWTVLLNGKPIGALELDEKDLVRYLKILPGTLRDENILEISCADKAADDIMVGKVALEPRPLSAVLSAAHIAIEVVDAETGDLLPSRITIANGGGTLQTVSGASGDPLAVRPGCVYTGSGRAVIGIPPGSYILYAGRGFEYGVDSARVVVQAGDSARHRFSIHREVDTPGWVSSDTHIHTFTYSRHGDASAADRVLTIAGEGLELPIITDHNLNIDLAPVAAEQKVNNYFTPVAGDELTTAVGHFNVFPLRPDAPVIDAGAHDWKAVSEAITDMAKTKAIVLNHARDIHLNFRPFDPQRHLAIAGMRLDGWRLPANAMEIINSGAQQTDQMQLTRDWFGMLNHGDFLTPAGGSDSHDVFRYIVGQARTYVRTNDDAPGNLNVQEAVRNFLAGNVMVSFGLLAMIEVNRAYGPGELAPASDMLTVAVKVYGPAWTRAEKVTLYANGKKIREEAIVDDGVGGLKWTGNWKLTLPSHDIFLVAVAEGPDRKLPYWPIAKPYQPTSAEWDPKVYAISGAVWVDGDRNGERNSAFDYARALIAQAKGDPSTLIQSLAAYDEAIAVQAAAQLYKEGANLKGVALAKALRKAAPQTQQGFRLVTKALGLGIRH